MMGEDTKNEIVFIGEKRKKQGTERSFGHKKTVIPKDWNHR